MYNGSPEHKKNLEKARLAAVSQKVECEVCQRLVSKAGIQNHTKACKKGKKCPVCDVWFFGKATTCSRGCANSHFRSGDKHPSWKAEAYRTTCFLHHDFRCCVCGEDNIVEVHHFDEDKNNNTPKNLIPLCPTHHQYVHSRHKEKVIGIITAYIEHWSTTSEETLKKSPLTRKTPKYHRFDSRWRISKRVD